MKTQSQRQHAQQQYNRARGILLILLLLTAVNIGLFLFGSGTMFLFSATIPYLAVMIGFVFGDPTVLPIGVGVAAAVLLVYLLCWFLSKKHPGWLAAALALFGLDCLALAWLCITYRDFSDAMNIILHAYILYLLFTGVTLGFGARKAAQAEPEAIPTAPDGNSTPLRMVEPGEKYRVLLEDQQLGRKICYRRMKSVNQLVIDGYVYDELKMVMEPPHTLSAVLDGHEITVGYGNRMSFLNIDGQTVKQQPRVL